MKNKNKFIIYIKMKKKQIYFLNFLNFIFLILDFTLLKYAVF